MTKHSVNQQYHLNRLVNDCSCRNTAQTLSTTLVKWFDFGGQSSGSLWPHSVPFSSTPYFRNVWWEFHIWHKRSLGLMDKLIRLSLDRHACKVQTWQICRSTQPQGINSGLSLTFVLPHIMSLITVEIKNKAKPFFFFFKENQKAKDNSGLD